MFMWQTNYESDGSRFQPTHDMTVLGTGTLQTKFQCSLGQILLTEWLTWTDTHRKKVYLRNVNWMMKKLLHFIPQNNI